ncbi:MAG TPA: TetR/AcrR family transcriptional regulator [Gryllotalpicola sp.]
MIDGAVRLLAQKGLQGTSFSEVLELTGAPRGSIYHHFPGGKDELVVAAVRTAGARTDAYLEQVRGAPPAAVAAHFLEAWRVLLLRGGFAIGCSVTAVAVAAESVTLLDAAAAVFREWRAQLAELLRTAGVETGRADAFAVTLIAASEGAVVMSRAARSIEPFETVAAQFAEQARGLAAEGSRPAGH